MESLSNNKILQQKRTKETIKRQGICRKGTITITLQLL